MRILHLIDSYGMFGAETVLLNLIKTQLKIGLKPKLLSVGDMYAGVKKIEEKAEEENIEFVSLRFRNGPNFSGAVRIVKEAKKLKADIIHSHGYKGDILMAMLPRCYRKIPVISTLHGWTSTRKWSKIWLYERANVFALRRLDGVAAVSRSLADAEIFKKVGIHPKFIPNGLMPLSFSDNPPDDLDLKNKYNGKKVINILNIGRLSYEKGINILIDALTILKDDNILYRLYLVGDGELEDQLIRRVKAGGIQDRVFFLGYRDKFYRYAPFFDLYVIPSRTEGLPMTLLEVMQGGIPVVATKVGEIPAVLKKGELGELVDIGNKRALAEAIKNVSQNYNIYKEKAIEAKKTALKDYSAQKMVATYIKLYKQVIYNKKR